MSKLTRVALRWSSLRLYASLLALGASVLLARTVVMLAQGAMKVLVPWVSSLLLAECLLDITTLVGSVWWWVRDEADRERFALRAGAAATILHAVRVLIFVLGRAGPWVDFDVRPEQRALHAESWSWGQVYFAAVLSALGVIGVVVIWMWRRRRNKLNRSG
jgi:hypothetical protein